MPSPNDARGINTKKSPEKAADLGQKLAKKRSQDFATKIEGWNQAGGGVFQKQNEVVVTEAPVAELSKVGKKDKQKHDSVQSAQAAGALDEIVVEEITEVRPTTPKTPGTPAKVTPKNSGAKKGRDVDLSKGAWVRRKSKPQVEEPVKAAATPKKRVVSDGHWRRDRPPKEETPVEENEKDATPKPIYIRKSVVNVGLKVPVSHQDFTESEPEPELVRVRPSRPSISRSRSRSAEGRKGLPDYETSGTKVYIKRRRASKPQEKDPRQSESSFTADSSNDKPSTATDITTPSTSPVKQTPKRPLSEPRLRQSKSREDEFRPKSARQPPIAEDDRRILSADRRKNKTPVGGDEKLKPARSAEEWARKITEPVKKTPGASTPPPAAPKVFGNRIEGWLANMPDPFTDNQRPSLTPEPLEIPKRTTRQSRDSENRPKDGGEYRHGERKKRTSPEDRNLRGPSDRYRSRSPEDSAHMTPASLKRSGARRKSTSPVKGRDSREGTPTNADAMMSGALPNASAQNSRQSSTATSAARFRIPSGGRPLSTIASTDELQPMRRKSHKRHPTSIPDDSTIDGSQLSRASDGDSPARKGSGLKRRGTKHEDLMSVLSMSKDDSHSIVSARSIRASRRKHEASTIGNIMSDLSAEELKYQRELRTLVDGVIPVLLQHALSDPKTKGSRVFSNPSGDTKPIVDMGVALERLRTSHKRIPMHQPGELLAWADSASKVYEEYLRAWRLGYKDIIVNLAPAQQPPKRDGSPAWDEGLPRNKDGDLLDGAGERVDVAYLLKRPLVRIKNLTKAFRTINDLQPSANAEDMSARYQDLILAAKRRVNDEQARLEDEAASGIDATRARDPRSLAPISGVSIDPSRSVRARDYFDMDLVHSSGQQLGCKLEIICRDDAPGRGNAGDLLFCEVSTTGRWLLFPPLPQSLVTARKGDRPGELVVMIRGFLSNARQWREVMSLRAEDEETSADWLSMLGSSPMPPRLTRRSSFNMYKNVRPAAASPAEVIKEEAADKSREPSPREIEVPIGERAKSASRIWDGSDVNSVCEDDGTRGTSKAKPQRYRDTTAPASTTRDDFRQSRAGDNAHQAYHYDQPKHARRPMSSHTRSNSDWTASSITTGSTGYSVWMPESRNDQFPDESDGDERRPGRQPSSKRPPLHRRTSSVPSTDMPSIPKLRKASEPYPKRSDSPSSDREMLPSQRRATADRVAEPGSAPSKLQKRRLSTSKKSPEAEKDQGRPMSLGLKSINLQSFTPAFLKKDRQPSSPLKHEYAPSSDSDSLYDSDYSDYDDVESDTSESTVEDEVVSTVGDLKAFQEYSMRGLRQSPPPTSQPTLAAESLRPSESASQGPYRTVPPAAAAPARTVANIFTWSDHGSWDSLHPEECQIFVSPGLIEAFDLTQANSVSLTAEGEGSTPSAKGVKPLVALELTPLVPLRRGTAVDISVRSPPTSNSLIRTGNNVMFRSRSPEECEKLYALINRARIDNPTFIALQNARGPVQQSNWGEVMDRRNAARTSSGGSKSWWNLGSRKSQSYRSKGSRTASIAATESSVGTMNSAFSALRRFSGGSRIFNIAKSTITSREGTRSTNSGSLSSGVATPVPFDPQMGTPLGITNTKIRLYLRESPSKWRDMGAGRLSILLPPRQDPSAAMNPRVTGLEKRILVYGKSRGETLLDVTLGESAFERIARTGIAVSVYEEAEQVASVGGVLLAKTTVYMLQMRSERDAAYTFGLVGKLRY